MLTLYLSVPGGQFPVDHFTSAELYAESHNLPTFCRLAPGKTLRVHASTRFRPTEGYHAFTAHAEFIEVIGGTPRSLGFADSKIIHTAFQVLLLKFCCLTGVGLCPGNLLTIKPFLSSRPFRGRTEFTLMSARRALDAGWGKLRPSPKRLQLPTKPVVAEIMGVISSVPKHPKRKTQTQRSAAIIRQFLSDTLIRIHLKILTGPQSILGLMSERDIFHVRPSSYVRIPSRT